MTTDRAGRPRRRIVEASDDLRCDLIVIGSHGYHGLDRALGTTASKVASHASSDVLVVHDRERAPQSVLCCLRRWRLMMMRTRCRLGVCSCALLVCAACNTAQLDAQPNATGCPSGLAVTCDAMPPGPNGCAADPGSSQPVVRELPAGSAYAVGCQASLRDPMPDQSGTCTAESSCECVGAGEASSSPMWRCAP